MTSIKTSEEEMMVVMGFKYRTRRNVTLVKCKTPQLGLI